VRAGSKTFNEDWEAIAGELPQRRQARRGGRVRNSQDAPDIAPPDEGHDNDELEAEPVVSGGTQDPGASASGDSGRHGTNSGGGNARAYADTNPTSDAPHLPDAG
jgi:hypothetical protein